MTKTSAPVVAAVIGCGSIGTVHAEHYAASPLARLAAVCDILPHKADALREKFGAGRTVTDYREILADPAVEAVSVCLPNDLHHPVTLAALAAGKHVLCEKPIALSLSQAVDMRDAARRANRALSIGVVNRYNTHVNLLRDAIRRGDIGEVYHAILMFKSFRSIPGLGGWFTTKARAGGGVMIDWGVHFLDLALYCLGFPRLAALSGVAHTRLGANIREYAYLDMWGTAADPDGVSDVEEYASGLIRAADGLAIAFEGAWAQNVGDEQMYIDFLGTKGGVRLKYGAEFTLWSNRDGVFHKTETTAPAVEMYRAEIDDFCAAVRSGKPSRAAIDTVLATQAALDAFYLSAREGREVEIQSAS